MLKYLSKMERTRSLIIVGFAILMAVSLVVFYAPGRNSAAPSATNTEVVASVDGDDITVGDLIGNITAQGGDASMLSPQIAEMLLNQMVRQRVIVQEAERLGLTASDEEVAARVRELNKDSSGKVDVNKYMTNVGDVARYEKQIRDSIAVEKLRAFVTAGINVSDEEVQSDYVRRSTTFDLVYVPVMADKLAAKINPTDQELRAYYEQHKTDYRILSPQKKIRYLFIDQTKVGEKIQIPDADVRAEYDKLTPEQKQGGHRVQQIILKVADPKLDETVKAKAEDLAKKARGTTGTATEAEFAELVKGHSEDPLTAKAGGWLAGVVKKNPNKPDDPLQRTFETEVGGISGPIKYGNAYYILRRGESVNKTFEEAKQELVVSLRNRKAYAIAAELAQRAAARLKETKDFQKVAQELATEANMTPAEMVKETPFVVPGDDVPNIGSSQQFEQGIEPLQNPQDVGERTPIKNGFAIPMLVEKKEPNRIPDFEEIKEKVAGAFRRERAQSQLEETARNLANSVNGAGDLKAAAEKLGLEAKTQSGFGLSLPLGELDTTAAAQEAIYALKEGEVTKTPIKMGDDWFIIGATKRKEADLSEFAQQRDNLIQSALAERRSQVFEDYILAAQTRMETEGRIKIYDDVIAKLGGGEPTIATPQLPQRPTRSVPIQIPAK
ncbi:MAG: peptidyl-prolyl cis-trans isomerase [Acidobacteriota bacterium]|jgi:peptidyl-prolyl cis-trans isomerase D|nr:peptidyl-prolyl cis-trans isomerase [Acidobacteriota bacterium]